MQLQGRVCVITGGANGIGRCIAETFAQEGASVIIVDTDVKAGTALAKRLSGAVFLHGDIVQEPVLYNVARVVKSRFERVDVLVNNACVSRKGILSECSYEDFDYVLRLGVAAPYRLTALLRPLFAPGASIINISSTRALMSQADTESYSAAKGGILSLTHALAVSLAGKVRVNAISPGWIDVGRFHDDKYVASFSVGDLKQHPAGRVGIPEDIAAMALFLAGPSASFITGQNFVVDGGMTRNMIYHDDCGWVYAPDSLILFGDMFKVKSLNLWIATKDKNIIPED